MIKRLIIKQKNKRGVSSMVGYVMLITFGIILSVIVFNYLKTYVPKTVAECPDSTSIFIKEYSCDMATGQLNITLKNNGKFNYAGYYIHAAEYLNRSIATINLVENFTGSRDGESVDRSNAYIMFSEGNVNKMKPGRESEQYFSINLPLEIVEITPIRFQEEGNTVRFISCGKSKTREEIICN